MGDLAKVFTSQPVEITDGLSNTAEVQTSLPSSVDPGLVVREAAQGQTTMAGSRPVVIASDQTAITTKLADFNLDAFGRLRVSEPVTMFDSSFVESNGPLFWDTDLVGSATETHLPNEATVRLRCTTASGDSAVKQTKLYMPYQPGKSLRILMSGVMGALKSNVRQRIGYFDASNGLFFEQDGVNLKVVRRTFVTGAAVDNAVNQSSWNIDRFDGTGVSGITLDMSKIQVFIMDFQWLGAGRVRMGFSIDGQIYYCHQFVAANVLSTVYMTRGSLPIRYEITNTGTAASSTDLMAVCSSAISEGGYTREGFFRTVENGVTSKTVSTTLIPLLSLRLKSANIRSILDLDRISVWVTNNADLNWRVVLNPTTLTGASWTSAGTNSTAEFDTSATVISGGETIFSGYTGNSQVFSQTISSTYRLRATIAGVSDIITIAAIRIATTDATVLSQIGFRESY